MGRTKVLALVAVTMAAVALMGCDKAKAPYLEGEALRLQGLFDPAIMKFDESMNVNPTSEFAGKAKVSKALSLYGKGDKLEKDGKFADMIDPYKKWVEMDPEKDLGKGPKAKVVVKCENGINEMIKGSETPEKRDTVRKLVDVITTYDDSPFKRDFWAAYIAAEQKNLRQMKANMEKAKKTMPPAPMVPYSTIWSLMELAAKLDDMSHPAAGHHDDGKKDDGAAADKGKPPAKGGDKKPAGGKGGKGGKPPKKAKK